MSLFGSRAAAQPPARFLAVLVELACFLAPLAILGWALRQPLASLGRGLWGAADPWSNGDFVGNFWCWWRHSERSRHGVEWLDATGWPSGGGALDQLFPNRVDAWLATPFFHLDGWWQTWNGMAITFVVLSVLAAVLAARLAGASRSAAATGALVLAMSPTFLHELSWGRMASFLFWPGLLAIALVAGSLRSRGRKSWLLAGSAGVLVTIQAVAYPFHGLATGVVAATALLLTPIPWRRRGSLLGVLALASLLPAIPWLASMASDFTAMSGAPPPAGYTSLPAAGLLGLTSVPERFRLLPLVLPMAGVALFHRGARPWAVAGLLGLGLALGPYLFWLPEGRALPTPLSWLMALLPWLERMHHPVRAAPIGLGALAVGTALLLHSHSRDRRRWLHTVGLVALWGVALAGIDTVTRVTTWDQPTEPPGVAAASWLAEQGDGPMVDLHRGEHMAGMSLQPWHRRTLMESVQGYAPASGGPWSPDQQSLADQLRALAGGRDVGPAPFEAMRTTGYRHLMLVDRPASHATPTATRLLPLLRSHLGEPAFETSEAWIWAL